MQVQSSQCTQNRCSSQNSDAGLEEQDDFEGNAQNVVKSLKPYTIHQIGKEINQNQNKIYNKSKHRQPSKEINGYNIQKISDLRIDQYEYSQNNEEQVIDKQKFTIGTNNMNLQNQSNQQNHYHQNALNDQILNKLLVKRESEYEKDQCRSASFSNNFQSLNQLHNQQNGGIMLNQIAQQGNISANSDQTLEQENQINDKMNVNCSNNSIPGLESSNEFEKKIIQNKNIKSNQTLTTLTTYMNTQHSVTPVPQIPSLSIVSKGSNILNKTRSKTSSFLSKNPSLAHNMGNLNDNLLEQPQEKIMQINNINLQNQISQNNISQHNNSQNNISQNQITLNNISLTNIPQNNISQNNIQQDSNNEQNNKQDLLKINNLQSNTHVYQNSFQDIQDISPHNALNTYYNLNHDISPNVSQNNIKQINKEQNNLTINNITINDLSNNNISQNNISINNISNNNITAKPISINRISNQSISHNNISDNNITQENVLQSNQLKNNVKKNSISQSIIKDSHNKSSRNLISQNNNENDQLDITYDINTNRQLVQTLHNNQLAVSDSSQIMFQQTKEQVQNSLPVQQPLSKYQQIPNATKKLMENEQPKYQETQQNQKQKNQNSNLNQKQKSQKKLQIITSLESNHNANNQNIQQEPQRNNQININKIVKTISDFDIKTAKSQDLNLNCDDSFSSSNKASNNYKNMYNINQHSSQNPRSGPSTVPSMKMTGKLEIENMDYMQHLRGGIHYVTRQPKTTYTTDIQSMNKDYLNSYCQNPSLQETKQDIENIDQNEMNDIVKNNKLNFNNINNNHVKLQCKNILDQISKYDQKNIKNVTKLLQKYIKYEEFMKFLILEAQKPIYNQEINFKVQFQFKPDSFLKDVVVQGIKKLEKNQMLAFADRQIERSSFYKILQSFYMIFHSIFLKMIMFYLISCLTIFSLFFTNQSISLIIWGFIVVIFLSQIFLSILYNFKRFLQDNSFSKYIFFFFCGAQIALVASGQFFDDRPLRDQVLSIASRSAQIVIDLILAWYFYNMNRASRLFLLCFKILQK